MTLSRTRRSILTVLLVFLLALGLVSLQTRAAEALDPGNVTVVVAPSAAAALGMAPTAASVAAWAGVGAAAATATAAAAVLATAGAAGVVIGWGVVHSGLWDWATGDDPVAATVSEAVPSTGFDYGYEATKETDSQGRLYYDVCLNGGPVGSKYLVTVLSDGEGGYQPSSEQSLNANEEYCGVSAQRMRLTYLGEPTNLVGFGIAPASGFETDGATGKREYQWFDMVHPDFAEQETTWTESGAVEDRQLTTEAECTDLDTGGTTTVTESTALYAPGSEPLTPGVVCPLGSVVSGLTISRTIDGGDGSEDEDLFTATPAVPLTGTEYDDCLDGSCELMLHRVRADGSTESCALGDVLCVGWITDLDRTENYQCLWGTHVMPLGDCEMFHAIDQPDATTGTATKPDSTVDSDLTTTTDLPAATPEPGTEPSGCSPWAFINPFSGGIAQGVSCALEWAAVPSTTVVNEQLQELDTHVMTKVPFAYADLVGPVVTELPATVSGACAGNLWDLTPGDTRPGYDSVKELHGPGQLAVPCTPPTWWQPVDALLTSMVVVATAWGLWNLVGVAVGGPRDGDGEGVG